MSFYSLPILNKVSLTTLCRLFIHRLSWSRRVASQVVVFCPRGRLTQLACGGDRRMKEEEMEAPFWIQLAFQSWGSQILLPAVLWHIILPQPGPRQEQLSPFAVLASHSIMTTKFGFLLPLFLHNFTSLYLSLSLSPSLPVFIPSFSFFAVFRGRLVNTASYPGADVFESWPEDRQYWPGIFMTFLSHFWHIISNCTVTSAFHIFSAPYSLLMPSLDATI
jgi:hypothetical protein